MLGVLLWSAVDQFGIPISRVRETFLQAAAGVGLVILVGLVGAGLLIGVRALWRRLFS
jgi:hypothetical protein